MDCYVKLSDIQSALGKVYDKWSDDKLEGEEDVETLNEVMTDIVREIRETKKYYTGV